MDRHTEKTPLESELDRTDPLSDEEEAAVQTFIAANPDKTFEAADGGAEFLGRAADVMPELKHGVKPQVSAEYLARARKTSPEKAERLEAYNREASEAERRYQKTIETGPAAAAKTGTG